MKKALVILLTMTMIFVFTACGSESSDEGQAEEQQTTAAEETTAPAKAERDLPEGTYEETGNGSFYLTGPSGSTENGDEIVIYPDMESFPHAYVGIELWDMDGSVQTYIYVDGVEMEKQQVGEGYQGSIDFDDNALWAITEGEHEVAAVQYADNDPSKDITFYRSTKYTVKTN